MRAESAVAGHMSLTHATVNCILQRHATTGTSKGAPRKTTPRQDRALFRMVQKDRFISARALMTRIRNLDGMRAGQKTINKRLLSHCYHAYRPNRKSLLTANHHRLHLEWAQRLQNLTMAHSQHVIFDDESRLQLYLVDGWCRVRSLPGERLQQWFQAYRVQAGGGSVHIWGAFNTGAKSTVVLPTDTIPVSSTGVFCDTP